MKGEDSNPLMLAARRLIKIYAYALVGAGVTGVGLSLALNLNKLLVLPVFPDALDAISIMVAGAILLFEVYKEASK